MLLVFSWSLVGCIGEKFDSVLRRWLMRGLMTGVPYPGVFMFPLMEFCWTGLVALALLYSVAVVDIADSLFCGLVSEFSWLSSPSNCIEFNLKFLFKGVHQILSSSKFCIQFYGKWPTILFYVIFLCLQRIGVK